MAGFGTPAAGRSGDGRASPLHPKWRYTPSWTPTRPTAAPSAARAEAPGRAPSLRELLADPTFDTPSPPPRSPATPAKPWPLVPAVFPPPPRDGPGSRGASPAARYGPRADTLAAAAQLGFSQEPASPPPVPKPWPSTSLASPPSYLPPQSVDPIASRHGGLPLPLGTSASPSTSQRYHSSPRAGGWGSRGAPLVDPDDTPGKAGWRMGTGSGGWECGAQPEPPYYAREAPHGETPWDSAHPRESELDISRFSEEEETASAQTSPRLAWAVAAALPELQRELQRWTSASSRFLYSYQFAKAAQVLELQQRQQLLQPSPASGAAGQGDGPHRGLRSDPTLPDARLEFSSVRDGVLSPPHNLRAAPSHQDGHRSTLSHDHGMLTASRYSEPPHAAASAPSAFTRPAARTRARSAEVSSRPRPPGDERSVRPSEKPPELPSWAFSRGNPRPADPAGPAAPPHERRAALLGTGAAPIQRHHHVNSAGTAVHEPGFEAPDEETLIPSTTHPPLSWETYASLVPPPPPPPPPPHVANGGAAALRAPQPFSRRPVSGPAEAGTGAGAGEAGAPRQAWYAPPERSAAIAPNTATLIPAVPGANHYRPVADAGLPRRNHPASSSVPPEGRPPPTGDPPHGRAGPPLELSSAPPVPRPGDPLPPNDAPPLPPTLELAASVPWGPADLPADGTAASADLHLRLPPTGSLAGEARSDANPDLALALKEVAEGTWFWKWTQGGKVRRSPEKRFFRIDAQERVLLWGRKPGRTVTGTLRFEDILTMTPTSGPSDHLYIDIITRDRQRLLLSSQVETKYQLWWLALLHFMEQA